MKIQNFSQAVADKIFSISDVAGDLSQFTSRKSAIVARFARKVEIHAGLEQALCYVKGEFTQIRGGR